MWLSQAATVLAPIFFILFVTVSSLPVSDSVTLGKREIPSAVYDTLVFYYQYASSAYLSDICPRPNGNTLISRIYDVVTDTQGFLARDDLKKEIVVSLRGATAVQDFLIDANIVLMPLNTPGVSAPAGVRVHGGFLTAWNSVASSVISIIRDQLADHPDYSIATTGHSLGGALSSLAGITLKQNFPNVSTTTNSQVRSFTYGQPRTGNPEYAGWLNEQFGPGEHFRAVHTTDPIPQIPRASWGYMHHGVEYWTYLDPSSAATTNQCAPDGEDPSCSARLPLLVTVVTPAHLMYFNILAATPFCT